MILQPVLLSSLLVHVLAGQVLLEATHCWQDNHPNVLSDSSPTKWNLDELPNPNATDQLVFVTVYSLLQHWSNINMLNGHNIVPGIIRKGTLLYHDRLDNEIPLVPEWVAMDPEHSYWSCGGAEASSCWHLTLVTTRPLKVVYFDGLSAANILSGTLDTQDLLAWGETKPERAQDERPRINSLCEWGKNFNVDGFVRMEMAFEIMLCNFTSGTSVVSFLNPVNLYGMPTNSTLRVTSEVWHAGSWHDHFPGETRIQLDLPSLVSFYDTQLAPSLVSSRAGQERRDYRVRDISKEDLSAVVSRLEAVLTEPPALSSGIDWRTHIQVIVDRYAGRLELIRHLLNTSISHPEDILDLANQAQMQLRIMLTPYLPVSAAPSDPLDKTALNWTEPVYEHCAMTHTGWMDSVLDTMTYSEKLLLRAVEGTNREICRVVTKMWTAGVYAGIDSSVNNKVIPDIAGVTHVWRGWKEDLDGLMAWLGWSVWLKCEPGCGPEEMCFLLPWPYEPPRYPIPARESFAKELPGSGDLDRNPKCVSLVDLEPRV